MLIILLRITSQKRTGYAEINDLTMIDLKKLQIPARP